MFCYLYIEQMKGNIEFFWFLEKKLYATSKAKQSSTWRLEISISREKKTIKNLKHFT